MRKALAKGTCFTKAYNIALNLGIANDIVTGYCYGYTDKSKFLHSWIETKLKGKEVVIDGTLKSDIEKYLSKLGTVPIEFYYVFRDEMIKDFEKNINEFER